MITRFVWLQYQIKSMIRCWKKMLLNRSGLFMMTIAPGQAQNKTSPIELQQMVICHIGPSNQSRRIRIRVKHHDAWNIQTTTIPQKIMGYSCEPHFQNMFFPLQQVFGAKYTETCGDHMMDQWIIMAPKPSLTSTPVDPSCCCTHCGKLVFRTTEK